MTERLVEVVEFISLGESKVVQIPHGENVNGRNLHTVWRRELCVEPCEWCEALVRRCKSRGGGVGGYDGAPKT